MNFGQQQLEKYGWERGKGLGKEEDGISDAIKPKLKFDTAGFGFDHSAQYTTNWWENVYKNASDNVEVSTNEGTVSMKLNGEQSVDITTKEYSLNGLKKLKESRSSTYGSFVKSNCDSKRDGSDSTACDADIESSVASGRTITDDELFARCKGRTVHKGARHGLKLSGKLARLEKQEKLLEKKLRKCTISESPKKREKKDRREIKKLKKCIDTMDQLLITGAAPEGDEKLRKKKKKSKAKEDVEGDTIEEKVAKTTKKKKSKDKRSGKTVRFLESCGIIRDAQNETDDADRPLLDQLHRVDDETDEGIEVSAECTNTDCSEYKHKDSGVSRVIKKRKKKLKKKLLRDKAAKALEGLDKLKIN